MKVRLLKTGLHITDYFRKDAPLCPPYKISKDLPYITAGHSMTKSGNNDYSLLFAALLITHSYWLRNKGIVAEPGELPY